MYLRYTTRRKDGKVHRYWRLVRSVRVGRRVIQQTVALLDRLGIVLPKRMRTDDLLALAISA